MTEGMGKGMAKGIPRGIEITNSNSRDKPDQGTRARGREAGGVNRSVGGTPSPGRPGKIGRPTLAADQRWAAEHLPDEHGPFVVGAIAGLRMAGQRPTVSAVRDRLAATGRDRRSVDERARRYR